MKRDFLTLGDLTTKEIEFLLLRAKEFKVLSRNEAGLDSLKGKALGLLFEKQSTRTRVSFEVAIFRLGGYSIYLSPHQIQLGRGEEIRDTARVFSGYLDAIVVRTYTHKTIEEWSLHSRIPVINGLTDIHHPCQAISDLLTILEKKGRIKGLKTAYVGDGNNVAHSLIEGAAATGMHITIASPEGYEPDKEVVRKAAALAVHTEAEIEITSNPEEAVREADIVYTDVWTSMGQEEESSERKKAFQGYQLNRKLIAGAKKDAIIMHCLPAHRGEEITEDLMESPQSVIFDQAENRLYMQMALLEMLMG